MDEITLEYDQLQDSLSTKTDASQKHPLLGRVDRWESKAMKRIQRVANALRSELNASLAETKKSIRESLRPIGRKLEEHRRAETFTEIELQKWMKQLQELKEQLDQPVALELIESEDRKSSRYIPLMRL